MEYEKYKVIISEKAKNMLASNIAFIAKASADAATKQKKAVIDGIRSLEQMPKRYPFFNEEYIPPNKYRKMFIKKWYLIFKIFAVTAISVKKNKHFFSFPM